MTREELEQLSPIELFDACDKLNREFVELAIADAERSIDHIQSLWLVLIILTIVLLSNGRSLLVSGIWLVGVSLSSYVFWRDIHRWNRFIAMMRERMEGDTDV